MAGTDFSIADVLAWARTKPADETYDFCNSAGCAVAQFGRKTGREHLVGLLSHQIERACPGLLKAVTASGLQRDWTFGGLVARLEALCPDQIVTPSEWTKLDAYLTDIEMARA